MIEIKQGWILAEAEFIRERELIEKIQEKKNEKKGDKKVRELIGKEDDEEDGFTIYPEDLTPIYKRIRFLKDDVVDYKENVDNNILIDVSLKFNEEMIYIKSTIEEFDKVFFG